MLRITGNDVPFAPGFQFEHSLQPDNANTYTHSTNLISINYNSNPTKKYAQTFTASRLFVKLRADANGRSWRPLNVDGEFDPRTINTFPTEKFNPNDSVVFVLPAAGLYNNGGVATLWHDHFVEEKSLRYTGNYYYNSRGDKFSFGTEFKQQDMQWIDILRPWIGAPIQLPNGDYTQSFRLGDYSDVWRVKPTRGALYASNKIKFRGLIAEVGARLEYWLPGKFVDEAVKNPISPIRDEIRADYLAQSLQLGSRNVKLRLLPKVSASFPIKENQVMFFNYNHAMILPHPSFVYAGLNPNYQDRSTLARVGNPNLNPEVDISYELGLRSQISGNDAINISAYWKDKYDFITSASVQIKDATGRSVTRTLSINADYARVRGLEISYIKRIGKWFNGQVSGSYSLATGQSSSASEALAAILNSGVREDTKEQYLAWDSPLDLKGFATFTHNDKIGLWGKDYLNHLSFYIEGVYRTGRRYTPYIFTGNDAISGRPIYERDPNPEARYSKLGAPNYWIDANLRKWWTLKKLRIETSLECTNLLNTLNTIIPNPVTGAGYQDGDDVPNNWRDPRYLDPRDSRSGNLPPTNPARYRAPRHIMLGLAVKF
jgi:outer membrane receptor protein involved in Fe transport